MKKLLTLTLLVMGLGWNTQAQTNLGTITIEGGLTWDNNTETNLSGYRIYVAPVGTLDPAMFTRLDEVHTNLWPGGRTTDLHGPMWLYATAVATNHVITMDSYARSAFAWMEAGDTNAPVVIERDLVELESEPSEVIAITFRAGVPIPPKNFQLYTVVTAAAKQALPPLPK